MAFQVSPGVNVSEIDLTTVVPAVSTTEGAIAGVFRWGPVGERVLVSSEDDLVKRFGRPHSTSTTTLVQGTVETISFDNLVLASDNNDTTDTYTLTIGGVDFTTAQAGQANGFGTVDDLAAALQTAIEAAGVTNIQAVNTSGVLEVKYVEAGNVLDFDVTLAYTGSSTDFVQGATTRTQGVADSYTTSAWSNVETWFTAADFLAYGNKLYVVRAESGASAASNTTSGISAKYPGALGDSLGVEVITPANWDVASTDAKAIFDDAPDASHMHIVVVDVSGSFTGVEGSVVEVYENVSSLEGARKEDGTNNYVLDVLEQRSAYIAATIVPSATTGIEQLENGVDGFDETAPEVLGGVSMAYDEFANSEEVDISLVLQGKAIGENGYELANYIIQNVCEVRKDCIAFISPKREDVVGVSSQSTATDNVVAFRAGVTSSSYGVMDSGYKYRYDKYNDRYVYTPLNGDIAGLCVRTDDVRDPWFSPAGYNRGQVKNVVKLAWNPSKAFRDQLYKKGINPVITQAGEGTVLFGDKTLQAKPSAFDRINVRRLFIVLEKAIARASKYTLFEFNDEFTRAQFRNLVEPFLRDVQGRRGIYDFRVVCDETNNTGEVIDSNRFVGDIYIKPARSINFIQLNFVAVRTGVEFSEIVGQF